MRYKHHGFSLIEMLVALVVFSVGLLAIAGLQTMSKQANFEALQRTAASQIAYGLLENMRINGDAIDVYPVSYTHLTLPTTIPSCRYGGWGEH